MILVVVLVAFLLGLLVGCVLGALATCEDDRRRGGYIWPDPKDKIRTGR